MQYEPDEPRKLMYETLVNRFGKKWVDDQLNQTVNSMYDRREDIADQLEEAQDE